MDERTLADLQNSYDRVAQEYVRRIYDELQYKPLDRELLDRFADSVRERGVAGDMGCGPGHVARYLHERGVQVVGVDLSPVMLEHARQLNPGIDFIQGNMLALDVPDRAWSGIAAFYSIIHVPRDEVVNALREWQRVLQPHGLVMIGLHRRSISMSQSEVGAQWQKLCEEREAARDGHFRTDAAGPSNQRYSRFIVAT